MHHGEGDALAQPHEDAVGDEVALAGVGAHRGEEGEEGREDAADAEDPLAAETLGEDAAGNLQKDNGQLKSLVPSIQI